MIVAGGSGMGAAAPEKLASDDFHVAIFSSSGKGEGLAARDGTFLNVVRVSRMVTPIMQKQGGSTNISSAWTFEPTDMFPTSAVFRAGLASTKIFADNYAGDNIRINNVLPGWIDNLPKTDEQQASVPLKRYGTAEEVAATIAFLASPGAVYITAQNIRIDGGVTHSV